MGPLTHPPEPSLPSTLPLPRRPLLRAYGLAGLFLLVGCGGTTKDAHLFRLVERTSEGKLKEYPNASVVDIDINSTVDIKLNLETFPSAVPDEKLQSLRGQMTELASLQGDAAREGQSAVSLAQRVEQQRASSQGLTEAESKQLVEQFRPPPEFRKRLLAYAQKSMAEGGPRLSSLRAEDVAAERQYLASEYARLLSLSQQSAYKLELAAWKGTEQLHVEGYDLIPTGPPIISDKTRFVFDSKFVAEYEEARRLAAAATNWNAAREQALQFFSASLTRIKDTVSEFLKRLNAARDSIDGLGRPTTEQQRAAIAAALDALKSCEDLGSDVEKAIDVLKTPNSNAADALQQLVGKLYDVRSKAPICLQDLKKALEDAAMPGTIKSLLEPIQKLAQEIAAVLKVTEPAMQPLLQTSPVLLARARDTSVSLLSVKREENDVVSIRARVLDGETIVSESMRNLRVRSEGFVADAGAVVLWARELNHEGHRGPFSPSAGAYAVIRFKGFRWGCTKDAKDAQGANGVPGECLEADAGSPFFHVLAPGLGVAAVVIPRLGSGSTDLAWMATAHLFGDVLQGNIGVTTGGTPVWGVGIGLHRIAGLGTYIQ
jgi:hypothetical protein